MTRVVGIGGTLREGSSSERLVRATLDRCAARGAQVQMFDGPFLAQLPHYDPGAPIRNQAERALVDGVRTADALVIASPGYHGGISGLVKNAIDLLEELARDDRPYFDGRPVGLIVSAAGWQATGVTLSALRGVVHAMRGWPTPLGIAVNSVEQRPFDADGALVDAAIAAQIDMLAGQLVAPVGVTTAA
ncbi:MULTISPECIES: NADPH-dependent FMN reductase [unclassified Sphingomonas]|uniref:NADPH-dependent FMN reductase n=1 Tax=unclassified Sphingomonas TaxID=196159 RepID=UPI0021506F32|nr:MULTISPECIES: NADPH-dependent FMN reductase [unclassified Sphingomonas]MCR5872607.1 NAD(P)H-dependent oxidoreductase [Sphingomonas sp. J344]UUX99106.1 NAD(P)H-dependent oxidoreductase [Sphingomonas sp. J315]